MLWNRPSIHRKFIFIRRTSSVLNGFTSTPKMQTTHGGSDLSEPTHILVPCWMPKPLPPRNECTGRFAPPWKRLQACAPFVLVNSRSFTFFLFWKVKQVNMPKGVGWKKASAWHPNDQGMWLLVILLPSFWGGGKVILRSMTSPLVGQGWPNSGDNVTPPSNATKC